MIKLNSNLWFGTEESYFALLHAQDRLAALEAGGVDAIKAAVISAGGGRGEDPFALPPMWSLEGNTAVIDINGSLVAGSAGFGRLFGVVGYSDIQQALSEVAMDKNAKSVLLNIASGGGQVDGLIDTGDMIRALDGVKPVMSYTGGNMASAAYWLGASARSIAASQTAQVGSIGTLIVHMERSQQLKADGINATVIRYGKYKALGNPLEPLSEDGKAQLQSLADASGKIFVDYVSGRRGMTATAFQKTAGEGRVFMGQDALDVGLVDAVSNMTGVMAQAKSLDKAKAQPQNPPNSRKGVNMKLSKKTVLAIAAGLALDKLGLAEPEANLEGVKLEGDALALAETEAKEVAAAIDTRVTAATAPLTAQVADLTAKAAAADAAKLAAEGKVALAEAAATTLQNQLKTSAEIAAQGAEIIKASMSVMSVALGGAADVGAALVGSELLAEHAKMADSFKKKFPTGGVAAVAMQIKKPDQGASGATPMFMHLAKSLAPAK